MNAQVLIQRWVNGEARPGQRAAALSVESYADDRASDGKVSVLYSYQVPIGARFGDQFIVYTTKEAADAYFSARGERGGSPTTSKHISWLGKMVRSSRFAYQQQAELTSGKVPESYEEWEPLLVAFDQLNSGQASSLMR